MLASLPTPRRRRAAFSLIEAAIAMGVGALALGGAFLLDSYHLRMVKSTRESSAASLSLEERVEQLRIATWRQITDAAYLKQSYFASVPKSISPLDGYTERIALGAWPDPAACQPLTVEKSRGASAQVITGGAGLKNQRLAKVDVQISWTSSGGRIRTREMTTVISNGGISRMNLPVMGDAAGSPDSGAPVTPEETPAEGGTSSPTEPDSSSGDTGSGDADTSPGNSGSTQGRGNVAGRPGQG